MNDMTFFDIVDIIVVAALLYVFLVWLKYTHSRRMVSGMLILGIVYFGALALELPLTLHIFQLVFSVLLIGLVIIFQGELRRFFEILGVIGIKYPLRKTKPNNETIDVLVSAADRLSTRRMGALMVIRGQESLERNLSGGVSLMGLLSTQLLESLFDNRSPGHDGAIVIENETLMKFGVHLPLSEDFKQLEGHGTRHAAALGLAEASDAFCLIVSEESGDISVAYNGTLRKVSGVPELRETLEAFYGEKFPDKLWRTRSNMVFRNMPEKLFALIIAAIAWYIIVGRQ